MKILILHIKVDDSMEAMGKTLHRAADLVQIGRSGFTVRDLHGNDVGGVNIENDDFWNDPSWQQSLRSWE